jgi:CO/xanthine dehydrogenase FAD-binding subunit
VKPVPFDYVRAESAEHALETLREHGDEAKVLAGGQSLVPALNMRLLRPRVLIDLNFAEGLREVEVENGSVRIGALVRQVAAERSAAVRGGCPLLAETLPLVGHFVTRNRGTVGGSIAHADAAAELPLCLVLLGGSVRAKSVRGAREILAGEFFVTHFTTALEPGELVVETIWPTPRKGWGYAFCELAQRHGDFALCMAGAAAGDGELRVAVGSVVDRPTLLEVDPDHPNESAAAQIEPWGNVHAPAEYLRHLVGVLVERAVATARERAET